MSMFTDMLQWCTDVQTRLQAYDKALREAQQKIIALEQRLHGSRGAAD